MHPNHNPELLDARLPAAAHRLDGQATERITNQLTRLREIVGNVNDAQIPGEEPDPEDTNAIEAEPLYGYDFALSNGVRVEARIDVDPVSGLPTGDDKEFVDARNRLAVLRSRERSRGSRMFNFAFMRSRGRGPGGHGYQRARAGREYNNALSGFIARKIDAHGLGDEDLVTEAVSRSIIQEQKQMSALENLAADQKSGGLGVLDALRSHKRARVVAGFALSGIAAVGLGTGQLEIAIPAMIARSALSATGGYVLGRTAWDAVQGRRARRLPHNDIRMAGANDGDFSGDLSPRAGFERLVKIHGAEARVGSHDQRRTDLAHRLGAGIVHEYYTGELDFTAGHDAAAIEDQVTTLHRTINPLQERRLKSDQTQSRRRHMAGLVGGALMGALPFGRFLEVVHLLPSGGHHDGSAHAASSKGTSGSVASRGGSSGSHASGSIGSGAPRGAVGANGLPNPSYSGGGSGSYGANGLPNPAATTEISINGGPGNDVITVGSLHEAAGHGGHGLGGHHLHETLDGISTGKLHVENGGGFISTLQEQYHLSPAEADSAYHAMYSQLHGAPGTYLVGSDIRISSPGDFTLPTGARAVLEEHLRALHDMPKPLDHAAAIHATSPEATTTGHGVTTANANTASYSLSVDGGPGNDTINLVLPHAGSVEAHQLQQMVANAVTPETGIRALTPEQASQAQAYIMDFVHHGGMSTLSPSTKIASQIELERYIQSSIEQPNPGALAHSAAERIHQLWIAMGHNLANMTTDQAKDLEENLALANAG